MPVPFNLTSLRIAFGEEEGARLEEKLCARFGREQKVGILALRQEEDEDLKKVADYVYEHVFVHYTVKQWGTSPEQIDPATTARVPGLPFGPTTAISRINGRVSRKTATPLLFEKMLDHPNITVLTGTPAG